MWRVGLHVDVVSSSSWGFISAKESTIEFSTSYFTTTHPTRGGGQLDRGRPRGEGRLGGIQARFYALTSRLDDIALDVVITGIVSVCHRDASVLFDPGSIFHMCHHILLIIWICPVSLLFHLFVYLCRWVILLL